jgi:hypothetical protein
MGLYLELDSFCWLSVVVSGHLALASWMRGWGILDRIL